MNYLLYTKNKKNKIISCDKWLYEGYENEANLCKSYIKHKEYRAFAKATFMRNVEFFSKNNLPYTIENISDDFFDLYKKRRQYQIFLVEK